MVNSKMDERERLEEVMRQEGMNAKQFAQEVGISAGTISNILGGRNKPSLDVLQSVYFRFHSLNPAWIFGGEGDMYRPKNDAIQTSLFDIRPEETAKATPTATVMPTITPTTAPEATTALMPNTISAASDVPSSVPASQPMSAQVVVQNKSVQKIIVFYTDGTFEER